MAEYGNSVRAGQAANSLLDGFEQVAVIQMVNQVGDDFRVGLALENVAMALEFVTQFVVVFNNPVVNQRDTRFASGYVRCR